MTSHGYIYAVNWRKHQHYKNIEHPPWVKMYVKVLDKDEYRELSLASRGLLHDLWKLVARVGQGKIRVGVSGVSAPFSVTRESIDIHVTVHSRSLQGQLNVRRVSLEPLIQAGFIAIDSREGLEELYNDSSLEVEEEKNPPNPREAGESLRDKGLNPRAVAADAATERKRGGAVAACRRMYNDMVACGDERDAMRDALLREYRHDPSIVFEAVPGLRAA